MDKTETAKVAESVALLASSMNTHPYTVVNLLAGLIGESNASKAFVSEVKQSLYDMRQTLPWVL